MRGQVRVWWNKGRSTSLSCGDIRVRGRGSRGITWIVREWMVRAHDWSIVGGGNWNAKHGAILFVLLVVPPSTT